MKDTFDTETYRKFIAEMYESFDIPCLNKQFDDRISVLCAQIKCKCQAVCLANFICELCYKVFECPLGDYQGALH